MAWVRGHYRRSRGSSDAAGCVGLVILGAVGVTGAAGVALLALLEPAYKAIVAYWPYFAVAAGGVLLCCVLLLVGRIRRRRRLAREAARRREAIERLWNEAWRLAKDPEATTAHARHVSGLRSAVAEIPKEIRAEFEKLYRDAVTEAVRDRRVTDLERRHLDAVRHGLGIADDVASRAELEGFLAAHAALIGDGKLTEEEELLLTDLKEALRVPSDAIRAQLARTEELHRARAIQQGDLQTIAVSVKLRQNEDCYHTAAFSEKKERVTRSYQEDGVRYKDTAFETVKEGNLYLTNLRLLLLAGGATNIKIDSILEVAVNAEEGLVALTVDGKKRPYYLAVPEPFVTAAFLERATVAGPTATA